MQISSSDFSTVMPSKISTAVDKSLGLGFKVDQWCPTFLLCRLDEVEEPNFDPPAHGGGKMEQP